MFTVFEEFQPEQVFFEVYIEDKLVNKQTIQAPKQFLIAQFMQTANEIGHDQRPMKIKMSKPEIKWSKFENKQLTLDNYVCFLNSAMLAWEEANKKKDNKEV